MTSAPDDDVNPFKPGTMAHQLWVATRAMSRIEPRPRRQPSETPRKKVVAVRLTGRGESNPQRASKRREILDWLRTREGGTATVAELEAQFKPPVRGHLQKLIEKKHLEAVEESAA